MRQKSAEGTSIERLLCVATFSQPIHAENVQQKIKNNCKVYLLICIRERTKLETSSIIRYVSRWPAMTSNRVHSIVLE